MLFWLVESASCLHVRILDDGRMDIWPLSVHCPPYVTRKIFCRAMGTKNHSSPFPYGAKCLPFHFLWMNAIPWRQSKWVVIFLVNYMDKMTGLDVHFLNMSLWGMFPRWKWHNQWCHMTTWTNHHVLPRRRKHWCHFLIIYKHHTFFVFGDIQSMW